MKNVSILLIMLCSMVAANAQYKLTRGVSGLPAIISFTDPNIIDYEIELRALDQHPIPSAGYGQLKQQLDIARDKFEAAKTTQPQFRKRSNTPAPLIVKGAQGNPASGIPNDNDIAVSNGGKVISVVNSNLRVYDDTLKVLHNRTLTALVSSVGVYSWISDPRVIYDPVADRFILVCFSGNLSNTSTILLGFTKTNDPAGDWNFYKLNGNSFNDSTWSDYPIISISEKDLFITFNQVKDNVSWTIGFNQSVIWQIDKQYGYDGDSLHYNLWSDIKYNGTPLRNICPAKYQSTEMGKNMYFLTLRNVSPSNDSIFLTEITDSYASGNAQLTMRVLKSPISYGFPPNARQKLLVAPRQQLMTNDARVLAAIYENDYIHFGGNSLNPQYMNAGVYLGRIKQVSSNQPEVSAAILSNDTVEYGYPSMAYMGYHPDEHKVLYTFSHCYTDSFPGTSVVYQDVEGNFSDVVSTKIGNSIINVLTDSVERWGDYTNIQRKYNEPHRAYLSGSWGRNGGMNCWLNIIQNVDTSFTPPYQPPVETILFPNPTADRVTVRFYMETEQQARFELLDMNGRRVALLLDTPVKAGNNEFSLSTQPLARGVYILRITTPNKRILAKPLSVF
jgi:hypothetical protein